MEYGLTRLALGQQPFVAISKQRFDEVGAARDALIEALRLEESVDVLRENYSEYEECILGFALRQKLFRDLDWYRSRRDVLLALRRTANLLTAARMYLDHTPHRLPRLLNDPRDALAIWDETRRGQYDTLRGYRVLEAVRNTVQHRFAPIDGIQYPSNWEDVDVTDETPPVPRGLRFRAQPLLYLEALREDPAFKQAVLADLPPGASSVPLTPLVREYMQGLGALHDALREAIAKNLATLDAVWDWVFAECSEAFGDNFTGLGAVIRSEDSGTWTKSFPVVAHIVEHRRALERKNGKLTNLVKRFVSSEEEAPEPPA